MSSRPAPPPAPKFVDTPDSVLASTKELIATSKALEDGLVQDIAPEKATFDNVIAPMAEDESQMSSRVNILGFYQYVSSSKDLRDASSKSDEQIQEFGIDSSMREDMYKLVSSVYNTTKGTALPQGSEAARLVEKLNKAYERNGLALPQEKRDRLKEIAKELSLLDIEFSKRLNEESGGLWFTREELDGVPADVVDNLKKGEGENEGKLWLTFKYPDLIPTNKYATNPDTRRKLFLANENKCNDNVAVFKKAIKLRDEKARLLGFKSHADFVLDVKMAKNADTVMGFLNNLREKLTPGGKKELERLVQLKKEDSKRLGKPDDGSFYLWDYRYYDNQLLETEYKLDAQKISEYFPLQQTIDGMLQIFEKLFGMEFVEVTDDSKNVWHEDTKQFSVYNEKPTDGSEQTFIGHLYLDLHPREGKYGHAFNLQPGFTDASGKRHYPATALVCNFSKPTPTKPSLLKHDEVVTLFHELGHGIHDLVSITHYSRFHGTAVVRDFVEAPSQMLENWCWSAPELKSLSRHFKTGEQMPDEMVDTIIKTKHVNDALANLRQLHFALFDMKVHDLQKPEDAEKLEPSKEYNRMRTDITLLAPPSGADDEFAHGEATFGHLMGGYDAGYYGYLWSQVFSTDMFYSAFKAAPMDPASGRRYRHTVLEKGGSQDEMQTLKNFLGREPNSKAFLEDLGIATD